MTKEVKKLSSISMKSLGYSAKEIRKLVEDKDSAQFLARIGGIAASHFIGEGVHGEWTGFKGDFTSVKANGEVAEASVIFLPSNISKQLRDRLEHGEVEIEVFADIFAVETTKNASGYAYMCEPVLSESADRRKQEITKRMLAGKLPTQLMLAAPETPKQAKKA